MDVEEDKGGGDDLNLGVGGLLARSYTGLDPHALCLFPQYSLRGTTTKPSHPFTMTMSSWFITILLHTEPCRQWRINCNPSDAHPFRLFSGTVSASVLSALRPSRVGDIRQHETS